MSYDPPRPTLRVEYIKPNGELAWHVCPTMDGARALVAAIKPHELRGGTVPRICPIDDPEACIA